MILKFDNSALKCLPIDPITSNYIRQVKDACFSRVKPSAVTNPSLVCASDPALKLLGIEKDELPAWIPFLSGNAILKGSEPAAHCYCGHQFGNFAGQLGDGAAIYLGEVEWGELQLKGAGRTPYSRHADGRKVLRSSVREFLACEYMAAVGVPTTRAATVIVSEDLVERDIKYDGNAKMEKCAVVLRMARSFLRFGSFELANDVDLQTGQEGPSKGNRTIVRAIANYTIGKFFPHLLTAAQLQEASREYDGHVSWWPHEVYENFYRSVVHVTANLVSKWMLLGFTHGVLNTDNMSIIGDTIDYGPYGFMEYYDERYVSNSSDTEARYAYKNQPHVCKWNCEKLGSALNLLLREEMKEKILAEYDSVYEQAYSDGICRKLGLRFLPCLKTNMQTYVQLGMEFLAVLQDLRADFTMSWRALNHIAPVEDDMETTIQQTKKHILSCVAPREVVINGIKEEIQKLDTIINLYESQAELMRLFLSDNRIKEIKDEREVLQQKVLVASEGGGEKRLDDWMGKYVKFVEQEELEAQEAGVQEYAELRRKCMDLANPKVVLRNHMAQQAIEKAEQGDYAEVRRVLEVLQRPFEENHSNTDCEPSPNSIPIIVS